jgi:hypothetical protein
VEFTRHLIREVGVACVPGFELLQRSPNWVRSRCASVSVCKGTEITLMDGGVEASAKTEQLSPSYA